MVHILIVKDPLENTRTPNLTSHVCVGGSTHDQTPAEHGGKWACVGKLVLRTLCEETQASNSCALPPTRLAPFPPAVIPAAIIIKGQLMILAKHPNLISKSTQILYVSNTFETSKICLPCSFIILSLILSLI